MKKSYQKPSITVVPVKMLQMLCMSMKIDNTEEIEDERDQW